jgi:hypothetical protein
VFQKKQRTMMNNQLSNQTIKALEEVYNKSVKLLELLNVIIPKIDTVKNITLTNELAGQVSDLAFELGTELVMIQDDFDSEDKKLPVVKLNEVDDDGWLDENYNPLGGV